MGLALQSDNMKAQKAIFWYKISVKQGYDVDRHTNVRTIARNLRTLQRGLTGDRRWIASDYMDERSSLQAYLLYYWAISFYETTMILAELDARHQLPEIHSVLDIGSGPGSAAFAANVFGARKAFLVDKSEKALALARGMASATRCESPDVEEDIEIQTQCTTLEDFCVHPEARFDLIVAAHSLNELWQGAPDWLDRRRDFVLRLLPALRCGGILLIVEPSAHYTSIPLLALRDALLSADTQEHALTCVGPCPHSESCPMLAVRERPCFSEWPWEAPPLVAELANSAGLDRTSLKAAWVALKKMPKKNADAEHARAMPRPPAAPGSIRGRIVSEPLRNKAGRIRYIVCTDTGLLRTISAAQDDLHARSLGFFQLARGDLIEAEALEERSDAHMGLVQGTHIRLVMKATRI